MVKLVSKKENIFLLIGILLLIIPALTTGLLNAKYQASTEPISIYYIETSYDPISQLYTFICNNDYYGFGYLVIAGGLTVISALLYKIKTAKSKSKILRAAFVIIGVGLVTALGVYYTVWGNSFLCWALNN